MPIDPEVLGDIKFFSLLDDEDFQMLGALVDTQTLPQGKTLFEKGDPGRSLYIVQSGEVELYLRAVTEEKIVLTVAGPGDFFGELSLSDQRSRTATAVALVESELLVMSRDNLLLFFKRKPDAALDLI